jgi:hypothetical protein
VLFDHRLTLLKLGSRSPCLSSSESIDSISILLADIIRLAQSGYQREGYVEMTIIVKVGYNGRLGGAYNPLGPEDCNYAFS